MVMSVPLSSSRKEKDTKKNCKQDVGSGVLYLSIVVLNQELDVRAERWFKYNITGKVQSLWGDAQLMYTLSRKVQSKSESREAPRKSQIKEVERKSECWCWVRPCGQTSRVGASQQPAGGPCSQQPAGLYRHKHRHTSSPSFPSYFSLSQDKQRLV